MDEVNNAQIIVSEMQSKFHIVDMELYIYIA